MQQNDQTSLGRRSVLCVQPGNREAAELTVGLCEYDLVLVTKVADAIRAMNARAFDAYVLDYWQPDWTGPNLCRHIRQTDPNVPICFFSTAHGLDKKRRAIRAGAQAYLSAADGVPALADKLCTLLAHADSRAQQARARLAEVVAKEVERWSERLTGGDYAQRHAVKAVERACLARGREAFIAAGGTLAMFARWWPEIFGRTVAKTTRSSLTG